MKTKKELEVDFIGGQAPLTKEEEKALSDFFKRKKIKKVNRNGLKSLKKRSKVTV